jgi:putative membrane protein
VSLDLVLELIHHVAVFSLFGVIAAEFVLIQPGLTGKRLQEVGALDGAYGGLATIIVLAGASRVVWGDAGYEFYVMNWTFWTKMALFVAVGLLSIPPTIQLSRCAAWAEPIRRSSRRPRALRPCGNTSSPSSRCWPSSRFSRR